MNFFARVLRRNLTTSSRIFDHESNNTFTRGDYTDTTVSRDHLPMIVFPRMRNRNGWNVVDAFREALAWFIDERKAFSISVLILLWRYKGWYLSSNDRLLSVILSILMDMEHRDDICHNIMLQNYLFWLIMQIIDMSRKMRNFVDKRDKMEN